MSKTVGIMGGMGPLATADLMRKIITHTPAEKDQEHLHIIVDNYPQTPDRTAAILGKGPDPTPYMIRSAQLLQRAGADFLVIACNSAHYFITAVQEAIDIPIMNMQNETARYAEESNIHKVGLLAATGTVQEKLYHKPFQTHGISVLQPEPKMQEIVMKGIFSIKGGDLDTGADCFAEAAQVLAQEGAEAIIAGCTEVPLVLHSTETLQVLDPTDILAQAVVKAAWSKE
jgi:aspartate racemase